MHVSRGYHPNHGSILSQGESDMQYELDKLRAIVLALGLADRFPVSCPAVL
jgi:hypothetical protein